MAYSTEAQILTEFKSLNVSGASTSVNSTNIARWIEEADAEIDSRIGLKYQTPITGTTSLIIMRQISIWLVAARIKEILQVKTLTESVNQVVIELDPRKKAMDKLNAIVAGQIALVDATLLSAADGVRSFAVDEDLDFEFDRTIDQW